MYRPLARVDQRGRAGRASVAERAVPQSRCTAGKPGANRDCRESVAAALAGAGDCTHEQCCAAPRPSGSTSCARGLPGAILRLRIACGDRVPPHRAQRLPCASGETRTRWHCCARACATRKVSPRTAPRLPSLHSWPTTLRPAACGSSALRSAGHVACGVDRRYVRRAAPSVPSIRLSLLARCVVGA